MDSDNGLENQLYDEELQEALNVVYSKIAEHQKEIEKLTTIAERAETGYKSRVDNAKRDALAEIKQNLARELSAEGGEAWIPEGTKKGRGSVQSYEQRWEILLQTLDKAGGIMDSMNSLHRGAQNNGYRGNAVTVRKDVYSMGDSSLVETSKRGDGERAPVSIKITDKGRQRIPRDSKPQDYQDPDLQLPFKLPSYALEHPTIADEEMDEGTYQKLIERGLLKRVNGFSVWTRKAVKNVRDAAGGEVIKAYEEKMLTMGRELLEETIKELDLAYETSDMSDAAAYRIKMRNHFNSSMGKMQAALHILEELGGEKYESLAETVRSLMKNMEEKEMTVLREDPNDLRIFSENVYVRLRNAIGLYETAPQRDRGGSNRQNYADLVGNMPDERLHEMIREEELRAFSRKGKYARGDLIHYDDYGLGIVTKAGNYTIEARFPLKGKFVDLAMVEAQNESP